MNPSPGTAARALRGDPTLPRGVHHWYHRRTMSPDVELPGSQRIDGPAAGRFSPGRPAGQAFPEEPLTGPTRSTRLFNRDFTLLWQGQFVSQIGNQLHAIAMMFWIKHALGSATLMGTIMMVSMLPGVLLGPLGGTVADRYSRRAIIILCDLLSGIGVLVLAALLFLVPERTGLVVGWIFALAVFLGLLGAFFRPAISAAIPDLVPEARVAAANSLSQSSMQVSVFFGQGLGGILFRVLGAPVLFLVDGLTYLFSALSEAFIRIPQRLPAREKEAGAAWRQFRQDTIEGFRHVWNHRGIRSLFFAAAFLNFLLSPFGVLLPFYVEDHLGARPDWFGFILAAFGIGSLLGYGLAGTLKVQGRRRAMFVITFLFLTGIGFAALALARHPAVAVALVLAVGILAGAVNINLITILQVTTPGEIRGRVFGLLGTLSMGLTPIGMGLAGVVADLMNQNIPAIYGICGMTAAALTVAVATDHHFRAFLAHDTRRRESVGADASRRDIGEEQGETR